MFGRILRNLICFPGQTAQLAGTSAAHIKFSNNITGEENGEVDRFICCIDICGRKHGNEEHKQTGINR